MGAVIFLLIVMGISALSASARGESLGCATDIGWVIAAIIIIIAIIGIAL